MATDLKQLLDAKIRKLQMLRELADDPDALAMLRDLVGSDGNSHKKSAPQPVVPKLDFAQGEVSGSQKLSNRGKQLRIVEETLRSATTPVRSDWIVERMQQQGFVFISAKPRVSVNESLRTLQEKGKARIATTDGLANLWEAVKEAQ